MNQTSDKPNVPAAAPDAPATLSQQAKDALQQEYLLQNPDQLRAIFNKYKSVVDTNNDGYWTQNEINAALAKPNQAADLKPALEVFAGGYRTFMDASNGVRKIGPMVYKHRHKRH